MGRPTLAVWKLASCDGCQLSLLDMTDDLTVLARAFDIAVFTEVSSRAQDGPFDLSLVEGSVSTPAHVAHVRAIRAQSRLLAAIGACATAGGIQALRNAADGAAWCAAVYPRPEWIDTLATATPVSAHVPVDVEVQGCPVSPRQLQALLAAVLAGRLPRLPAAAQCAECKRAGTVCVTVAHGTPCLGPVTRAGCGNLCPPLGRGCFGCFGPVPEANTAALAAQTAAQGVPAADIRDLFATFNAAAPAFAAPAFAAGSRRHG
jgi:coenzyme F420-reducing hydrogenase gamma subunit